MWILLDRGGPDGGWFVMEEGFWNERMYVGGVWSGLKDGCNMGEVSFWMWIGQ